MRRRLVLWHIKELNTLSIIRFIRLCPDPKGWGGLRGMGSAKRSGPKNLSAYCNWNITVALPPSIILPFRQVRVAFQA